MFFNYLKTAVRNLKKNKLFSLINIIGLAVGMAACLLILSYVSYEKGFDEFHEDHERIFRLRYERTSEEGTMVRFASCCPPAAGFIRDAYPEVEKIARIFRYQAVVSRPDQDIKFLEERMYFAEPEFFEIFNFTFTEGDPFTGIREANQAFISQSTAKKYFDNDAPIGKILSVDGKTAYTINGVFEDIPRNSHLKFDLILSYRNLSFLYGPDVLESWGHTGFYTYIKFAPDAVPEVFEEKMVSLVESQCKELMDAYKVLIELKLQPLTDIHLTSHFMQEYEINGSRSTVNFLLIVAVFIIIMAWVNYVNLTTAHSLKRAKEVGLRKVVGASRLNINIQFFFETLSVYAISIVSAIVLLQILLPYFSRLAGTPLDTNIGKEVWFWLAVVFMFLAGVFLSGAYPVAAVSAFQPAAVLKGKLKAAPSGLKLRKVLVAFQFVIALGLLSGAFSIYRQLDFMKDQNLGFDIEQILVVKAPRIRGESFASEFAAFKEELLKKSRILKFCVVTEVPGRQIYWDNGGIHRAGEDAGKGKNYLIVGVDYDFVDVFDMKIKLGRNFSKEFPADKNALLLNETAVKWMGFNSVAEAVGDRVDYWGEIYPIIGVLSDYHQQSLKESFEPHIYRLYPYGRDVRGRFAMKISSQDIRDSIRFVQQTYAKFFPENPFEYFFLDDYFNQQYQADELLGKVIGIFSFLAIFVTSLGIFGMSSFIALQRFKEIGIRKVLGATTTSIFQLLASDFLTLIGIALVIAWPLTFWGVQQWLNTFAYRMTWSWMLLFVPLVIVAVITAITISSNIFRAAFANPVDSIKHE